MKKYATGYLSYVALVLVIITVVSGTSYHLGRIEAKSLQIPANVIGASVPENASTTDFALFWRVWNTLDNKFVSSKQDKTTDQEKLYGAIKGLAESYGDPYTVFYTPEETKDFESEIEGSFQGVGMEVSLKDGILTVVAPLKDSPAERAGIKSGDKIIKINNTLTNGMTVDQAVKMIRGEKGTKVSLVVLHEGADSTVEISIVRDNINIPTIETKQLESGIYMIRLFSFSAQAQTLFANAIKTYVQTGNKKLIIDLRGNPGGYMDAAVDIASWFLPSGNMVVTEEFRSKSDVVYHRSKGYNIIPQDHKIVILIDGGSASASEILAGALKEYDRATLIGTNTFGKGSVQEYMKLSSNTSLKVTIARWLTPKGVSISEGGLKPDIEVKISTQDKEKKIDTQLNKAIEFLTK